MAQKKKTALDDLLEPDDDEESSDDDGEVIDKSAFGFSRDPVLTRY